MINISDRSGAYRNKDTGDIKHVSSCHVQVTGFKMEITENPSGFLLQQKSNPNLLSLHYRRQRICTMFNYVYSLFHQTVWHSMACVQITNSTFGCYFQSQVSKIIHNHLGQLPCKPNRDLCFQHVSEARNSKDHRWVKHKTLQNHTK